MTKKKPIIAEPRVWHISPSVNSGECGDVVWWCSGGGGGDVKVTINQIFNKRHSVKEIINEWKDYGFLLMPHAVLQSPINLHKYKFTDWLINHKASWLNEAGIYLFLIYIS